MNPKKIVLAYSGGLDTSVILPWLKERYPGVAVIAFVADLGQGDELAGIEDKLRRSGADDVIITDARREFLNDFCFPMLRAGAAYERDYLLGTAIARPLIARLQVRAAEQTGADAVAHGATSKGNDQVRFELAYMAMAPRLKIIAPWKDPQFRLNSREAALAYARERGVPVDASPEKMYSRDRNLWHMSHEGGSIEDPRREPPDDCLVLTVPAHRAPDEPAYVELEFREGRPVGLDGRRLDGVELLSRLNSIAATHAVGQTVLVENRLVGIKSRGVYETPGGTVLYEAIKAVEQLTLERDTARLKQQLSVRYGELVYYGQWFHPLREALQAFFDRCARVVTGKVRVKLYKGRAMAVGAESPTSLYDPELASFAMGDYDVSAARGFIDLFGLPLKVRALRQVGETSTITGDSTLPAC